MHRVLASLLNTNRPDLAPSIATIATEADKAIDEFRTNLYPRVVEIDRQIPGIGMQCAVWSKTTPHYPFPGQEFDGIVRPLRYVPYKLASRIPLQMISRSVVFDSGGHLEECVKDFCRTMRLPERHYEHKPLGTCTNLIKSQLRDALAQDILRFCSISWNQAKHRYRDGLPKSVISVEDAIVSYFVARILGAKVLTESGRLDAVVKAVEDARRKGEFYVTGELP